MRLKQQSKEIKNKMGLQLQLRGCEMLKLEATEPLQSGVSKWGLCVQRPLDNNSIGQICLF